MSSSIAPIERPRVRGKFIFVGDEKLYIRGVTYGTFRASEDGSEYRAPEIVERDLARMAANGINAIRTYTVPPRWLLDIADSHGLRVMVGLPWEQHVAFLDKERTRSIEQRVREGVRACAGHPSVLCYVVGNEIPASIVRWYGRRRIERFIERLYRAAKAEDPDGLVTYVNYPSTEYLHLSFVDFVCFNVYIESRERLDAYLARLQNIADDRPLVLAEVGLDSLRNGEDGQAQSLDWQVRTAFADGCAGVFVFAWTDEWHRSGHDVVDWDFGLTDRNRRPKQALEAVRKAFSDAPFPPGMHWPRISVVVCSCNGERTIRDCLEGLLRLDYPNYEVIVVNDGSTDQTAIIAHEYNFRVISTKNRGLSSARNSGLQAATGEIVAYIDDDAYPDPHWLTYLAATFLNTTHAGVGGPNLAPAGDGLIADCVANSPGGPIHVLLSDREAEHIPGCNMAFRRDCLQAIGGFDPQFRVAGDDVDVCWQLQRRGWTLGFSPVAVVWHHRRNSVRAYLRQQRGYGKAEALLERKWPDKYNAVGHLTWAGRLYGQGAMYMLGWGRGRIYQGTWGSAAFQSVEHAAPGLFWSLTMMPEWYLVILALAVICAFGVFWTPLLFALPLLAILVGAPVVRAGLSAARSAPASAPRSPVARLKRISLTAFLHLAQPLARLYGRLRHGLTPWRLDVRGLSLPWARNFTIWSEHWKAANQRLQSLEADLQAQRAVISRGGDYDRWDLEVRSGLLGAARMRMAIEEHGAGRQLVRLRVWPRCSAKVMILALPLAALSIGAALDEIWPASVALGVMTLLLALRMFQECAAALFACEHSLRVMKDEYESTNQSLRQRTNGKLHTVNLLARSNKARRSGSRRAERVASGDHLTNVSVRLEVSKAELESGHVESGGD